MLRHFLNKFSLLYHKNVQEIEDDAMDLLQRYNWPGNVRELENAIEYAVALTKDNEELRITKLPAKIRQSKFLPPEQSTHIPFGSDNFELVQILEKHHWNKTKAAKKLGVGRTTLWRRMKALGLNQQ